MSSSRKKAVSNQMPLFAHWQVSEGVQEDKNGICQAVIYREDATGHCIMRVRFQHRDTDIVVMGVSSEPVLVGDALDIEGDMVPHAEYGLILQATRILVAIPDTVDASIAWLKRVGVLGVGPKLLERLVEQFGDQVPVVLGSVEAMVAGGIPAKKAKILADHWNMQRRHRRLMGFLYGVGLGPATAVKIADRYGDAAYSQVVSDPYKVSKDVRGVGFLTADRIALSQGWSKSDPRRVRAAILYTMYSIEQSAGDCAVIRQRLLEDTNKLLVIADRDVDSAIDLLLDQGDLVSSNIGGRDTLMRASVLEAEEEVAMRLVDLCDSRDLLDNMDDLFLTAVEELNIPPLDIGQSDAVKTAMSAGVSVVTGNPGTGKTSSVSTLLWMLRRQTPDLVIQLAAPTGRAARRMTEQSGFEALTIHRLLGVSPQVRGFLHNEENPLECDVLVVDEASMLTLFLFRDILRALKPGTRLILVGDIDQLPSVGIGSVLSDVISSGVVPVGRLTKIFRQGAGSGIALSCAKINRGIIPPAVRPNRQLDFWLNNYDSADDVADSIVRMVSMSMQPMGFDPIKDVQVLVPGHNGSCGEEALNRRIQEVLNPFSSIEREFVASHAVFRLGDRVIQNANNYELDVYNGDIGFIESVSAHGVVVLYDGERSVVYEGKVLSELALAYAITIHRSQGSEFPAVIVGMSTQSWIMLQRNLLYTAVSRARRLCAVITQTRAISVAVKQSGGYRLTGLAARIASRAI